MKRARVRHLLFDDVILEGARLDVEPLVRDDPPLAERVLSVVPERDELVVALELGEREAGGPLQRVAHGPERPVDLGQERAKLGARGRPEEAPDTNVDGVDLPSTEQRDNRVAGLLDAQAPLDGVRMVLRHRERVRIPEEVGSVQHEDVKRMALDPLAAVKEAPQAAKRAFHADPERILDRVAARHLVGDRADAADARGDVRDLRVRATPQERLEEPRWLEDAQLDGGGARALDADGERALALDARERVDLDGPHLLLHGAFPSLSSRADSSRKASAFV